MAPRYKCRIDAGATYRRRFILQDGNGNPVDLTGYRARSKFRTAYGGTVGASLTDETGGLSVGGIEGYVDLVIPDSVTKGMATTVEGRGIYDIEICQLNGDVTRVVEGEDGSCWTAHGLSEEQVKELQAWVPDKGRCWTPCPRGGDRRRRKGREPSTAPTGELGISRAIGG